MRNSFIIVVFAGLMVCSLSPAYSEELPVNVVSTGVVDLFAAFDGWYSVVEYERAISGNSTVALGAFTATNELKKTGSQENMRMAGVESSFRRFSSGPGRWHFYYGGGLNIFDLQAERTTAGSSGEKGSAIGYEPKVMFGEAFRKERGFAFTVGLEIGYLISDLKLGGEPVPYSGSRTIARPFMSIGWGW